MKSFFVIPFYTKNVPLEVNLAQVYAYIHNHHNHDHNAIPTKQPPLRAGISTPKHIQQWESIKSAARSGQKPSPNVNAASLMPLANAVPDSISMGEKEEEEEEESEFEHSVVKIQNKKISRFPQSLPAPTSVRK